MGIPIEAYSPLRPDENPMANPKFKEFVLLNDKVLLELGKKYGKSPAQIVLKWHAHQGHIFFPRMTKKEHMAENMQIFDFELAEEDYQRVSALNRDARYYHVVPTEEYNFVPLAF